MRASLDEQCVIHANAQFWEQMLAMTLEPMRLRIEVVASTDRRVERLRVFPPASITLAESD